MNNDLDPELKVKQETIALEELNAMLEEEIAKLQMAEEKISRLNEDLENKVLERTNQLQEMNTVLEEEIVERILAEKELSKERVVTDGLFNSAPGIIYLYDDQSKLVRWNKKHEEMTGYNSDELAQKTLLDWYEGDIESQTAVLEGVKQVNLNGFGVVEANLQKKDGTKIPMYLTASSVTIEGKVYFAGIGIDMTEQKKLYDRLQKYQVLAKKANDAMFFIDMAGNIIEVNDAAVKIYGYTSEEFSSLSIFDLRRADNASYINNQMESAYNAGIIFETIHYLKSGDSINVEVSSQGTFLGNKRVLLSIVRDITDRKKREEEYRYISYHDFLTGMYNRRFYEIELKRLDTEKNLPISIIIGDVNGLKLVNDTFGHAKGDELLQQAATAIQRACRADDIVARWGGDEFVVLLPKTVKEEAKSIVKRIKELSSNVHVNEIPLSISFGWETKITAADDLLNVLKIAENAMYNYKNSLKRINH